MPQIFASQYITEAGIALAAQATASNRIEYIGALSSATVPSDPREQSQYTGRTGTIDAASATDDVARVVAAYKNALVDSPQDVKAIAILGKLSSQADSEAVIVAYATDANSTIVLPRSSAPAQVMRFAFNLGFDAGTTTPTFQAGDATLEDLDRLVSCHKPGQSTSGQEQTIYGQKHFKSIINANQIAQQDNNYIDIEGGSTTTMKVRVGLNEVQSVNAVSIIPSNTAVTSWLFDANGVFYPTGSANIGKSGNKIANIYATRIGTVSAPVSEIHADAHWSDYTYNDYTLNNRMDYSGYHFIRTSNNVTNDASMRYEFSNSKSHLKFYIDGTAVCDITTDGLHGAVEKPLQYPTLEDPSIKIGDIVSLTARHPNGSTIMDFKRGMTLTCGVSQWRDNINFYGWDLYQASTDGIVVDTDIIPTSSYAEGVTEFVVLSPSSSNHVFLAMRIA